MYWDCAFWFWLLGNLIFCLCVICYQNNKLLGHVVYRAVIPHLIGIFLVLSIHPVRHIENCFLLLHGLFALSGSGQNCSSISLHFIFKTTTTACYGNISLRCSLVKKNLGYQAGLFTATLGSLITGRRLMSAISKVCHTCEHSREPLNLAKSGTNQHR